MGNKNQLLRQNDPRGGLLLFPNPKSQIPNPMCLC
jgi:hypothetical protein